MSDTIESFIIQTHSVSDEFNTWLRELTRSILPNCGMADVSLKQGCETREIMPLIYTISIKKKSKYKVKICDEKHF